MFVVMRAEATEAEVNGVKGLILAEGLTPFENAGAARTVIAVVGEIGRRREPLRSRLEAMAGVAAVTAISKPYKLVSREFQPDNTVIGILDTVIGDGSLTVMAGPCSVESREQLLETVDFVVAHGANVIRGGAFKPRTSPYSFQGLGVEGLRYLAEARERTGIPVITEVMEPSQVDIVAEYADILQVGTRNMQNFSLLLACGRAGRPVMLKRGFGATIEEWLMAAEYIASAGNGQIILCERGIRTFETSTRNTLDLTAVPLLHHLTHLPVVVDPSHATGKRWLVKPLAIGSVAVGADGIMVEVHPRPEEALSDGEQSRTFELVAQLMTAITGVPAHVRDLHGDLLRAAGPDSTTAAGGS
ncbi:MAG: 3-deoxy-7-phosphoheptulonate synthase [Chloroflexi bacterium]|nr:3-deoxy-7-phosphoheptulonate synthase [Chloroflexota bacterium]